MSDAPPLACRSPASSLLAIESRYRRSASRCWPNSALVKSEMGKHSTLSAGDSPGNSGGSLTRHLRTPFETDNLHELCTNLPPRTRVHGIANSHDFPTLCTHVQVAATGMQRMSSTRQIPIPGVGGPIIETTIDAPSKAPAARSDWNWPTTSARRQVGI